MRRKSKFNLILIIFILVLVLGLGYAYLTTTLSINGTTDVDSNTWNVYWDNVQVQSGSVTGGDVIHAPTIDPGKTTVSFEVHFSEPGDFYEFTVDAKNDGTIDAMIETINSTVNNQPISNLPAYLEYRLTYSDGTEIENNQLLPVNKKETYKIYIGYRTDIDPNQLPATNEVNTIDIEIPYVQATRNATPVDHSLYYTGTTTLHIGQAIPDGVVVYHNYQDAIDDYFANDAYKLNYFTRLTMDEGIITEAYAGVLIHGTAYYLKGGDTAAYDSNKQVLLSAYESGQCTDNTTYMECKRFDLSDMGLRGYISNNGYVEFGMTYLDGGYCYADSSTVRCA